MVMIFPLTHKITNIGFSRSRIPWHWKHPIYVSWLICSWSHGCYVHSEQQERTCFSGGALSVCQVSATHFENRVAVSIKQCCLTSIGIPIFNMGIPIPWKGGFILRLGPDIHRLLLNVPDLQFSYTDFRIYSISQEICTRFFCVLLCCGYAIVHNEFTWSIYPYSSGLLCWHWGNR